MFLVLAYKSSDYFRKYQIWRQILTFLYGRGGAVIQRMQPEGAAFASSSLRRAIESASEGKEEIARLLGDVVLLADEVGIGEGLVHRQREGMVQHDDFLVAEVTQGLAHDVLVEGFVVTEQGVDDEVVVVEVPREQLDVLVVSELYEDLALPDAVALHLADGEAVLMVDGVEVDVDGIAEEPVVGNVFLLVGVEVSEVVDEAVAVLLLQLSHLAGLLVGELCQHDGIVGIGFADALRLVIVHTLLAGQKLLSQVLILFQFFVHGSEMFK